MCRRSGRSARAAAQISKERSGCAGDARSIGGVGGIERDPLPATVGLTIELVRRPVMLVELQRDDVGLPVPGDRLQTQRGAILFAAYHRDEGIEIRRRLTV